MNLSALTLFVVNFFQSSVFNPEDQEKISELTQPCSQLVYFENDPIYEQVFGVSCFVGLVMGTAFFLKMALAKTSNYKCCFCNEPFTRNEVEENLDILALKQLDLEEGSAQPINKEEFFNSISKRLKLAHRACLHRRIKNLVVDF